MKIVIIINLSIIILAILLVKIISLIIIQRFWLNLFPSIGYLAIVDKIIREKQKLDTDKLKLDEDDWYFCLKRRGFNFRNLRLDQRLRLKKMIDKDKGHLRLQLMTINVPGEPELKGFKVTPFNDYEDISEGDIFDSKKKN